MREDVVEANMDDHKSATKDKKREKRGVPKKGMHKMFKSSGKRESKRGEKKNIRRG